MVTRRIIAPENVWDSRPQLYYAQGLLADETIYISGQTAWDEKRNLVGPGDIESQTRMALEDIRRILEAEGAKMSDIVKMIFFTKDIRFLRRGEYFAKVLKEFFGPITPPCTGVQIGNLWNPDFWIEIEAYAVKNAKSRKIIAPANVWDARPELYYAQGMNVDDTIYISGQTAWDEKRKLQGPGDIETQARLSLENIRRLLEAEGAKMSDVVKMIFFTKDMRLLRRDELFAKVLKEFFGPITPPCTAVQIANLWNPDFLIEIEAIAVKNAKSKKIVAPSNVWDSRPKQYYAQAMNVDGTVYFSGQTALDENSKLVGLGDIEAQTRQSFENIRRLLESEGKKMSDIVKMIFFTKDIRYLRRGQLFAKVLKEVFGPITPPCTGVQ
ncbi:MAG: RidA family protein, partial [Dehalococcoidia bacterium]|nr:RidA family protein [Dehalococcoidia bacterium]